MTTTRISGAAALLALVLAGCEQAPAARVTDPQVLAHGERVFQANCAVCHGAHAQGAPNWERPGADGKYPPPPLDGSAHAWHHPRSALQQVIKDGTVRLGGDMPAWGGKLSDRDIDAVIAWFQSRWPDEIYAAWTEIDARARR